MAVKARRIGRDRRSSRMNRFKGYGGTPRGGASEEQKERAVMRLIAERNAATLAREIAEIEARKAS